MFKSDVVLNLIQKMKEHSNKNELREVDSIKLTINDKLVDYISKEEGVSIKDAPSSFMLRNIGMSVLNLDIAI